MRMVQAVVFDVGETLVNEARSWRAWAQWLKIPEHAFFATLGAVIERGEHHQRVFELLRPGFSLAEARAQRSKAGIPDQFDATDLYRDVADCLSALHSRGLKIGIAGNQPDAAESVLNSLSLPVDFVGSSARWGVEKPSTAFFERIAAELRLPPSSIAHVGDRLDNDVLPALEAGMVAVFLRRGPWGFVHARRPEIAKAHLRIESLRELPEALSRY
jgi:HAD superfamily hydrolase (TIGR01549 family)